jgi:hypothetical protein
MDWAFWACILIMQQGAQTWTSRARNTKSLVYHSFAAVFSNGVWAVSQLIIFDKFSRAVRHPQAGYILFLLAFYTFFCVTGSVAMHWLLMHKVEPAKKIQGG